VVDAASLQCTLPWVKNVLVYPVTWQADVGMRVSALQAALEWNLSRVSEGEICLGMCASPSSGAWGRRRMLAYHPGDSL
jgi:hypothetical protein